MNLICWDLTIPNDTVKSEKIISFLKDFGIQNYIYLPFNEKITYFYFVWKVDIDNAGKFYEQINDITEKSLQQINISLNTTDFPDNVKILYWDYQNITSNDTFITFDVSPIVWPEQVYEKIIKHLFQQNDIKLIVQRFSYEEPLVDSSAIRIDIVY